MRTILVGVVVVVLAGVSVGADPDVIAIPLKDVWAHAMPDTRDIHELESTKDEDKSLMAAIGRVLEAREGREIGEAFAVPGTGADALKAAFAVFAKQPEWSLKPVKSDGETSLVFFTTYSPYYIHLSQITREGKSIRIEYDIIPHRTDNRTLHFALIPVGKLPAGEYDVAIVANPVAAKHLELGFKEVDEKTKSNLISSSFAFHVD